MADSKTIFWSTSSRKGASRVELPSASLVTNNPHLIISLLPQGVGNMDEVLCWVYVIYITIVIYVYIFISGYIVYRTYFGNSIKETIK